MFSLVPRCQGLVRVAEVDRRCRWRSVNCACARHLGALVPGQRPAQVRRAGSAIVAISRVGARLSACGRRAGAPASCSRVVRSTRVPIADLLASPDDQIAFRKTVAGPGEPGVAEIALRCGRLLGMFARLSGVPWLLIEICARSLVTDASAGCSTGRCQHLDQRTEKRGRTTRHSLGRHRCRQDPSLGVRGGCRRKDVVVGQGRQRRG